MTAAGGLLPTFLGIGCPRAGTTWLHELLATHPQVRMPTIRKELNFFDLNYHRGLEWYEQCFARGSPGEPRAVGEITPVYVYSDACRERIRALGTVDRFLVCIRDPVALLWSAYRQACALDNFTGDLAAFMRARPDAVRNGFYARALRPWIDEFGLDAFLFLRLEEMTTDVEGTKRALGKFLDVDPDLFPPEAGQLRPNRSAVPRFRRTYSLMHRAGTALHRADLSWVVNLGKRLGALRLVSREAHEDGTLLTAAGRRRLAELYRDDLVEFGRLTGQDLSSWLDDET
ncbi:MAG TPA: sulfotransferase [Acidimicrobiales bacterium]